MSQYSIVTNFLSKDSLVSGNPLKAVRGAEFTTEFTAVQTALNSKFDGVAVFGPDGTAGQPSFGFTNNAGTGMYNAAGVLGFSTGAVQRISLSAAGNVVVNAPASGVALSVNGLASSFALEIIGTSGAGTAAGLRIRSGTNSADVCAAFNNSINTISFLQINGDGGVTVGAATGGDKGLGSINAVSLFVNGTAVSTSTAAGANPTATIGLSANNGVSTNFMRADATPALGVAISPTWTGNHTFSAASGTPVTINGVANSNSFVANASTTSGQSFGLVILGGTTAADYALRILNAAGTQEYLKVVGEGSAVLGNAPGGAQGLGTLNATGLFVNGVAVGGAAAAGTLTGTTLNATVVNSSLTSVGTLANLTVSGTITNAGVATTGSFTGTLATGGTTTPTMTCKYTKVGNSVTMRIAATTYVSNATGMTLTGLPAAIQPATGVHTAASAAITNNGNQQAGDAFVSGGTMTFATGVAGSYSTSGFTGSGTKGFLGDAIFVWDIN